MRRRARMAVFALVTAGSQGMRPEATGSGCANQFGVIGLDDSKVLKIIVDAFKQKVLIIRTQFRDALGVSY